MKLISIFVLQVCCASLAFGQADTAPSSSSDVREPPAEGGDGEPQQSADDLAEETLDAFDLLYDADVLSGDRDARIANVERRLRRESRLPEAVRYELAALIEHRNWEKAKREAGSEESWRELEERLLEEFPRQPYPYEALASAAERNVDREERARIAQRLLGAELTPSWIADRAQALLARDDLAGLSLRVLLSGVWEEGAAVATGAGRVVLYSWSIREPELLRRFADDLRRLPGRTQLLGVCLDGDAQAAAEIAAELKLPGLLYIDALGVESLCAQRLSLNMPFLVYRTDDEGLITDAQLAPSHAVADKQ